MIITLSRAAELLLQGEVVAIPTDTVYGLAALATDQAAVKKLFIIKGRPSSNPLVTLLASADQISLFADDLPLYFKELTSRFWPGGLTLALPVKKGSVLEIVRAGLSTAGFRVPNHDAVLALLEQTGPLVAPSANLSGEPPALTATEVESIFGDDFPILDGLDLGGRETGKGTPSTVLSFTQNKWAILRQGAISAEELAPFL